MSDYGLAIKNYEAGSLYAYNLGVRSQYDYTDAMLTNSLFLDFLKENKLKVFKDSATRDIICIEFNYGTRSYDEELKHIRKTAKELRTEYKKVKSLGNPKKTDYIRNKRKRVMELYRECNLNKEKYKKVSKEDIRTEFYQNGVEVCYINRNGNTEKIHYKMLYRTPGKAKKGSCMFIRDSLYKKARNFLYMGIRLKKKNAPIVEIGAYSSLITSTIVDRIQIKPEDIVIMSDVKSSSLHNAIAVTLDGVKRCKAVYKENYEMSNTMFDGQALIDSSIFPTWADGYILLRHHFTKCAAFNTNLQLFFKDYYKDKYDTATVKDVWGNEHLVKDIKMITTTEAVKWIKFNVPYEDWCKKVYENNCMFGIVKSTHESKLGEVQRMSYQMTNSLNLETMDKVTSRSKSYVFELQRNEKVFLEYLKSSACFHNDFEVLAYLAENNPEFLRSKYYRERKRDIINKYVFNLKNGKLIQDADNLTIVGSPYGMLLHCVGESAEEDYTFEEEDGVIQCYTERFLDGEYLASFRSPFNSRNNLVCLHNSYHPILQRYFNFGKLIIAVNMNHTDWQDRNNGADQDSDSVYTTNQREIVEHARYCMTHYPTVVNEIPKETNHYDNTLENFALIDNRLAASQRAIGESSNLAQLCLTYSYNSDDKKYENYACILAVLAQAAIDNAKRTFDVDIPSEIQRIKTEIDVKQNKYPLFWLAIRSGFNYKNINMDLKCPMNYVYKYHPFRQKYKEPTLDMSYYFRRYPMDESRKKYKKIERLIENYSLKLFKTNLNDDMNDGEKYLLLRSDFDQLISDIRQTAITSKDKGLVSWLLNRAFLITNDLKNNPNVTKLKKNKSLLLDVLYKLNKEVLLDCLSANLTDIN